MITEFREGLYFVAEGFQEENEHFCFSLKVLLLYLKS